jgi:hypothetical protein
MPTEGRKAMAINGVAQDFWSEVFNLHAPIDDHQRPKSAKVRAKKVRRVASQNVRLARAS